MEPTLLELAEDCLDHVPPRPGVPTIRRPGFLFTGSSFGADIRRIRLAPGEVDAALAETRALARQSGLSQVLWWCGELSTPVDLVARLRANGLAPDSEAPVLASLAIERRPEGEPALAVRRVETADELVEAVRIDWTVWGVPEAEWPRRERHERETWDELQAQAAVEHYVAVLGGRPVGFARAVFGERCGVLLGGATLPEARGHGAYSALVHARWEAAVARGVPRLVVQAGHMSAPILERLGFRRLGETQLLLDRR